MRFSFPSLDLSTCLPVHLSTYPPVRLCTCGQVDTSTDLHADNLTGCACVFLSLPSICPPVDLSTCRPVYLSTCPPVDLSTCRLVKLPICLPVNCRPFELSWTFCSNSVWTFGTYYPASKERPRAVARDAIHGVQTDR